MVPADLSGDDLAGDDLAGDDRSGSTGGGQRWHQALAYALLGQTYPSLGTQRQPDLGALVERLDELFPGGRSGLNRAVAAARGADGPGWPRVVPNELRAGLGPAQFTAALGELRRRLVLDGGPRRTLSARSPDAADQKLLRDVPPHHGS